MKIRHAVIGSTVLFAAGCWGPTQLKLSDAETQPDAVADVTSDTSGPPDVGVDGATDTPTDPGTPFDAGVCYERPDDPLTLLGTSCSWEGHAECSDFGEAVAVCLDQQWTAFDPARAPDGETCYCEVSAVCDPPILFCEFIGVGFVGIRNAGRRPMASRSLRLV
jgi:hypothetical protein